MSTAGGSTFLLLCTGWSVLNLRKATEEAKLLAASLLVKLQLGQDNLVVMTDWCRGYTRSQRVEVQRCHLSAVNVWAMHFTYLNPSFSTY